MCISFREIINIMVNVTLLNKPVRFSTQATRVVTTKTQVKKVISLPAKEVKLLAEESHVAPDGYVHGASPSVESSQLELNVEKALQELGATTPDFLKWKIGEFLDFIHTKVEYRKASPNLRKWVNPGHMMTCCTLEKMGESHPHLTSWYQLTTKEAIDFILGVDIAITLDGDIWGFDVTANREVVKRKEEKAEHAFCGARLDVLRALGCKHYVVVLGEFDKDIGAEKLREKLSHVGENEITSISLIRPKNTKVITLIPSGPKLEETSEVV
jgi:hypothetical protein